MFLLAVSATATSLITEAIKKTFGTKAPNITAFIVSIITGALIPIGYLLINSIAPTVSDIVYVVAMVVLTWLCATLGFDKVKQAIEQLIGGKT